MTNNYPGPGEQGFQPSTAGKKGVSEGSGLGSGAVVDDSTPQFSSPGSSTVELAFERYKEHHRHHIVTPEDVEPSVDTVPLYSVLTYKPFGDMPNDVRTIVVTGLSEDINSGAPGFSGHLLEDPDFGVWGYMDQVTSWTAEPVYDSPIGLSEKIVLRDPYGIDDEQRGWVEESANQYGEIRVNVIDSTGRRHVDSYPASQVFRDISDESELV